MFSFTSSVDGNACCIGELNPNTKITLASYYVQFGEDRLGGVTAFAGCWDVVTGSNYNEFFNFTALTDVTSGTYLLTCTDCNNYPITPECIADSALVQESFTWPVPSGSLVIMIKSCAILAYIL